MEEELNVKTELIKKQENLIQEWQKELKKKSNLQVKPATRGSSGTSFAG